MEKVDDLVEEARKKMIAETLASKGLTQQDLANLLGRSLRTVQSWISKESIPELTPQETKDVLEVFGDIDTLVKAFPGTSKRRAGIKRYHKQQRTNSAASIKNAQE